MKRDLYILRRPHMLLRHMLSVFLFILSSFAVKAQCPPTVVSIPSPASVCVGDSIHMVCSPATGTTWQWYLNGVAIPGATNSTCYAYGDGIYTVRTAACAFPSNPINVIMKPVPAISISSSATTLCSGTQVTLTVSAGLNVNWVWFSPVGIFGTNTNPVTQTLSVSTTFQVVGVDQTTNCSNTSTLFIPVVPPLTAGSIQSNSQVCSGGIPPLITGTSATGGSGTYAYQWQISTTSAVAGFVDIPGATGLNYQPGATSVTTWYRRVVMSPPCPNIFTNTVVVQVNPAPVVTSATTKRICSGTSVAYTPTANIAGSTFTWTGTVTTGTITGVTASGNGTISDILTLPAGSSTTGTVTYVITPIGPAPTFCPGTPINLVVTVYPTPLVTTTPLVQDICAGDFTTLVVLQSNVASTTFTWTASATAGLSGYQAAGSGNIPSMQIFSTLLVAGTVTYTITPHGPAPTNCNGPTATYVINVNPSPSITNISMQQTICSGASTILVSLTSNMPSPNFTWTASSVPVSLTGFLASGTNTIPVQTITNPSNVQGTVTYVVVPSGSINGCPGIPRNYLVYVNPIPVMTATPGSQDICSGQTTGISLTSNVTNTTFSWTASAPSSILGFSNSSGNTIAQTLTNTSNAPHDVTYVITPTSNGCAGIPVTVVVTVNPAMTLTAVPVAPFVCSGSNMVINLVANVPGVSFTWTASAVGNVTGYSNGSGPTISQTLVNNDNVTRTVVYAVVMSLNGCTTSATNFIATVYPQPALTNTPLAATRCSGAAFNLALTSSVAGSSYTWIANGTPGISGYSAGNSSTINQTLINSTNTAGTVVYTITPSANGCPGTPVDYTVTVNPTPNVVPSLATQSICSGTSTIPVSFSSAVAGTTYTWTASPSGAGITGYTASGSVSIPSQIINSTLTTQGTVTYIVTPSYSGCTGSNASHVVTINPRPVVTNATMSQAICTGATSSNVILLSNVAGTSFTWIATPSSADITGFQTNGGNTIPPQTIFNSSITPGTVSYQIIPTSTFSPNCQGTTAIYTITVNPTPSINSSLISAVCSGQPFSYAITSDLAGGSYTWTRATTPGISNSPAAGSSSSINETLINLTSSDIVVTYVLTPFGPAPTTCPGTAVNLDVTVRALPTVNAGINLTIPYGTNTSITGTVSGGTGASSYVWTPNAYIASGATTLVPQTINLIANRTYTLSVTDAAGCTASDAMTVFITGTALAAVPTATPSAICLGQSSIINANATGGSGTYSYSWISAPAGFTSTSSSATVSPVVNTVYTVTVNDGFNTVTSSVAVTVNPLPNQFVLTGGGSYCIGGAGVSVGIAGSQSGVTYQLYCNSSSVGTPILGNGGSLSFGNQTLAGSYTVVATRVSTGCSLDMGSSVSVSINTLPVVNAGVDQTIPFGTSTTLNGSVSGGFGVMNYSWTPLAFIGVGANTPTPLTSNLYSTTTYTLTVIDANGCAGSDQMTASLSGSAITVTAVATPNQICADTTQTQLHATVSGGAGTYTYSWVCTPAGSPAWSSMQQNPFVSPDVTTTYTVTVNDGFNTAIASATVVVNPLPLQYAVTGGGVYCFAGTGVSIGLSGSEPNTNYQLYRGGVPDGPAVTGTGNPISFGNRTAAFNYTVVATNNVTGCINQMNGSATIVIIAPPAAYVVTGGGSYPFGGPGRNIGLSHGDAGISYQLYRNNIPVGTPVLGTETSIDFGLQTQAGTYTVIATDLSTGCTADMSGSVNIIILPLPIMFEVFGGGTICAGAPGLPIGLTGSEAGVGYQLLFNGFPFGALTLGTNFPLTWGPFTFAGLFEVRATNSTNGATQMMHDSAVIVVNPLPTIFTINPTGSQCPGTILRLNGSESGLNYILLFNGFPIDTIVGTGVIGFLDYGPQTMNGTYTIKAVNPVTGCEAMMNGSTYISIAPQVFNVIPAGILCPGQIISLTGSEVGVNYQLRWNGTFDLGSPVAGTGSLIVLGTAGLPGVYSAIAIDATTNCVSYMNDSATLYPDPTAFTIVPDGVACEGDIVSLNGSQLGVDYVLVLDNAIHLDTISGTGSAISFGPQLTAGNYTIIAIDQTSYCQFAMNGTAILNDSPIKYTLQPAGIQCLGTTIGLSGSQAGISYQLMLDGVFNIGSAVAGTGSAITFGPQSLSGIYTVRAVNDVTGCNTMMSDSTVLEPLPNTFLVIPTGNHCAGTSVILNGSEINFNYILVLNGAVNLDTIPGTGSSLNFGPQTTSGSYSVVAYNSVSFCSGPMTGTTVIDAAPSIYIMTPAGIACQGAVIGLVNSEFGVSYQLRWNGTTNVGTPVAGTGAAISFGTQTLTGTYTIMATNSNSCSATMNGSVVINALPIVFTVTPSGTNCESTPIGLNGSEVNVNYVLVLDGIINVDTIAGTGAAVSFGAQITAGTYTVIAYNTLTNCMIDMDGSSVIEVAPVVYTMTPAGIACQGAVIGLVNSESGVSYQLRWNGTTNVGTPVAGTGAAISFGAQTLTGTYTVMATGSNSCSAAMNGSVVVNALPIAFNLVPAGTQCQGAILGVDGSETGVNYILVLNGSINIDTISGSGTLLSFGPQATSGVYTVIAYNATTFCQTIMNGSTVINPAPAVFNMTPAGVICSGAFLGLDNSETGVSYQLRLNGTINIGPAIAGTGSAISFGVQALPGSYTAVATNSYNCSTFMNGTIVVNPLPVTFNITPAGIHCQGALLGTDGSESGVNYVLILNGTIQIDTLAGTGAPLSFGAQATSGVYTVIAFNAASLCSVIMNGSTVINPAPAAFNMIPAGIICSGTVLGLDNSETGVTYQLRLNGSINVGLPVAGTGAAISFGAQTLPGTYTAVATNSFNCSTLMNGSVIINSLPIAFNITPAGLQCQGTSIGVDGSESGINYILVLNGSINIDTIAGNGAAITFGAQSTSGIYTVVAYTSASCQMMMNGTTTLNSSPFVFNMIPAGVICAGTALGIDGSNTGVTYQLRRNGTVNAGTPVAGTGLPISFGIQTVPGIYTIEAAGSNGCTAVMNGSVVMNVTPLVFTQLPGGSHCAGTIITLNGSEIGMNYILYRDGIFAVDTLAGTGLTLNFGTPMIAGTYTIIAVSAAATCQAVMNGNTIILVSPTAYNVTPAGIICSGNSIGLDDSEPGVNYQLRRNGITNVGAPVAGTGSAINFGIINISGTYTVVATSLINGCAVIMNGTAVFQPMPLVYTIAPQGMQCSGVSVSINGSQVGTDYVLVLDNTFNLDTLAGTGNALNFGPQLITGTYTVIAIGGATTCQAVMTGSTQIMALPAAFNITPAGLICATAVVGLDGSETGVNYTLYKNNITTGITVAGTGSALSFGTQTFGNYTVKAVNQVSLCSIFMTGTLLISTPPQVNAGSDAIICADQTIALNATVTFGSTTTWSTTGDGTFDNTSILTAIYTPGTADIAAGTVNLLLTAYGTGSCSLIQATDTVTITLAPLASANAGSNINVCSTLDYTIAGASATNYNAISWTTSGTGSFVNGNTLSPTYVPSVADLSAGSVSLTLHITGNSPCNNLTSDVTVMTFYPMVAVNAGPDNSICSDVNFTFTAATASNFQNLVWSTTGSGTFAAGSTLTATYSPSAADLTAGSTKLILTGSSLAPCAVTAADTMVLTYIPAPVSNAGADVLVCENTSLNIIDASVANSTSVLWSTSGSGSFSNASTVTTVYSPSLADIAAGSVILTLTVNGNATCTPATDQKIVTFILNPVVNAGADTHICTTPFILSGATSANCASVVWTIQTGSGTLANAGTLTPSYTASATDITNGFVILVLTGNPLNPCTNSVNDLVTLTIDQTPVVNAGADSSTCNNSSFTVTDATATHYTNLSWISTGTGTLTGIATLTPTYTPTAGDIALGSVSLALTATNAGCGSVSDTKVISFINQTLVNAGPDAAVCEGSAFTMGGATASAYSTIAWTTSGSGSFTGGNTLTPVYTPGTSDIANGNVTLTISAVSISPCANVISDQMTLTIQAAPVVWAGNDALICSTSIYNNNDAFTLNCALLTWTTSGTGTFSNPNSRVNIYTPDAADIASGSVMLTLTTSNNGVCADVTDQKEISFQAAPVANAGPSATICNSCTYSTVLASVINATGQQWSTSGSGSFTSTSTVNTTYTPSPADYAHGSVVLSLTAFSNPPCSLVTDTMTIYFSDITGVGFTWGAACEAQPVTFSVDTALTNIASVVTWLWNFGDGTTSALMNPTHLYAGLGQYTVSLTAIDNTGSAMVMSHIVTVSQLPVSFFSYSTPNCSNQPVVLTDLSHTLYGYIAQFVWNYGDGSANDTILFPDEPNVAHQFTGAGIYNVTLTVTNSFGCMASVTLPVDVIEAPIANFQYSNDCSGLETSFLDASYANGAGNTVQYTWDFGDPSTGVNNNSNLKDATHLFSAPGIYQVMHVVRNFNNCSDTIIKPVTILARVVVDFIYDHTCVDGIANFAPNTAVMNVAAINSWAWDFGDGTTNNQQITSHVYAGPGSYQVSLTVTDTAGCTAKKIRTVVVNPLPVALFDVAQLNCQNAAVHFDDLSTTYAGFITKWSWNFGDGNTQTVNYPANPDTDHIYTAAGTHVVTLTIVSSDSCTAERQQTIVISPAPTVNFEYESSCQGTAVQFNDLTQTGGTGTINGWAWNFGDAVSAGNNTSTLPNPLHTFVATGSYQVTLTVSTADGCSSTMVKTITITAAPFVDFSFDNRCVATDIQFTPAAGVVIANVSTWSWSFGDGFTSALSAPQHTYTTAGNYNVILTITNLSGCQNTISHSISILPAPIASFSTSAPACSMYQVAFTNHSTAPAGYIMRWEYNFGDGTSQVIYYPGNPNVSHAYTTYGNFNPTLTVVTNDSCSATTTRSIQILQSPLANFDYDVTCSGVPVQFTDLSQGNLILWTWNFGDSGSGGSNTSTIQNPVHTFQQAGNYQVSLLIQNANGCHDTVTRTISITPKPVVDFSFNNGCAADTVHFISSTYVNMATTASWLWNFGDNTTATTADPYHVYSTPGIYTVSLTINNQTGCTNIKTRQVQVTTAPIALFSSNTSSCSGTAVLFTNISSTPNGIISNWTWDFGDGTVITINAPSNPNVSHAFAGAGIYDVKLSIQTSTGCEASYTSTITIVDAPSTAFSFEGSCNGIPTAFTDLSQAAGGNMIISWSWNFGDPVSGVNNTSAMQNPQHVFSGAGPYSVSLTTENNAGCTSTLTQTITITPAPAVDFLVSASCEGMPVTFGADPAVTNISQVASYLWNFGDGSATSPLASPVHLYTQAGSYTVTLTIINLSGCANSVSHPITIHALPVAQFTSTGNCTANLAQFTDISYNPDGEAIIAWAWDFGVSASTGDTSSLQNPSYIFTSGGTYNVTLTITSASGCTAVKVMPVTIIAAPVAQYSYVAEPCHNGSVLFQDESTSAQSLITGYYWEFSPGVYSTLQNPVHVFGYTDTCYNVKLVVTTSNGCSDTMVKQVCIPMGLDVTFDYTQTCIGETTWFTPTLLQPVGGTISFYNWNFGDPATGINNVSVLEAPHHTFSKSGTFVVSLQAIDINNCNVTKYITVTVSPLPIAAFSYTGGACDSLVSFKDLTTAAPVSRWIWSYGDGSNDTIDSPASPNTNHYYPYPGVYDVTLITQSVAGCYDTIVKTIRRTPCIAADFDVNDTIVCQKRSMRFSETSTCEAPIASWQWFFGDNTSEIFTTPQAFVEHTYAVAGIYTVKMIVATQMVGGMVTDTASQQVVVKPAAKAAYTWQDACIGNTSAFVNTSTANSTTIKSYLWNFGVPGTLSDTTSVKHPEYKYGMFGQYDVKLVVTNTLGCTDTIVNKVNIFETPSANFKWNSSCEVKPVMFSDNSDSTSSAIVTWNWLFSKAGEVLGASTDSKCNYSFGHAGIYDANLKITDRNGCSDTITKQVAINSSPVAAFSIEENFENMQGQLKLNNGTLNGTNYAWDFGNGKTSSGSDPVVLFDKEGHFEIQLITWNGQNCADTITMPYDLMYKGLFVPNAFNPDNLDAEVAVFKPKGTNLKTYTVEVFDRWGNLLWSSSKLDARGTPVESWDGKLHGEILKQDVYLWKISARFKDGEVWDGHNIGNNDNMPQTKAGTVTLIR